MCSQVWQLHTEAREYTRDDERHFRKLRTLFKQALSSSPHFPSDPLSTMHYSLLNNCLLRIGRNKTAGLNREKRKKTRREPLHGGKICCVLAPTLDSPPCLRCNGSTPWIRMNSRRTGRIFGNYLLPCWRSFAEWNSLVTRVRAHAFSRRDLGGVYSYVNPFPHEDRARYFIFPVGEASSSTENGI